MTAETINGQCNAWLADPSGDCAAHYVKKSQLVVMGFMEGQTKYTGRCGAVFYTKPPQVTVVRGRHCKQCEKLIEKDLQR